MAKGHFVGNWVDYWTLILIGEPLPCEVEGYGTVRVAVPFEFFKHNDHIKGTCFEGFEQVDEGKESKMSADGKVCGILYWNVDTHVLYAAAPPIPVEVPKIILAPWIAREASQYT